MDVTLLLLVMSATCSLASAGTRELQDAYYQKFLERHQVNEIGSSVDSADRKTMLVNPDDPLHAYPDAYDEFIHRLFQRVTIFEINNADKIRGMIGVATAVGIVGLVGIVLGGIAFVAPAAVAIGIGRRSLPTSASDQLMQLTSTILESIQKGHALYHQS